MDEDSLLSIEFIEINANKLHLFFPTLTINVAHMA